MVLVPLTRLSRMERTILPSDFRRKRHDYNGGVGAGIVDIGKPIITV